MVARPCTLEVMWERKGDCVILSRRFSSRIRTLERERVLSQRAESNSGSILSASEDTNPSSLPGHNVQNCKEDNEGRHSHQEPRENPCDHSNTEEHQDDVLDEHLCLEGQPHVDWGHRKETRVRLGGVRRQGKQNRKCKNGRHSPKSYLKCVF